MVPALRERVLRGGLYLSARQLVGLVVGVLGIVLLTRLIGPTQYGLYRGALDIMAFFAGVARWGLDAYLIRRKDAPSQEIYHQAFALLSIGALGFVAFGFASIPLLGTWLGDSRYLPPLKVLLLALPLTVLSIPALAQLERDLDYRKVAVLETLGQVLYHGVAVGLATVGWGLWAPVAGYVAWQTWTMLGSWKLAAYRPGWHWSRPLVREMLGFGAGYSASFWVFNLRSLVNPLIVGRFLGPQQVGFVSLTIRLVEVLGFVRTASFRLALAALGRLQEEPSRLRKALEEAMGLQALALGIPLALFALVAPVALPRLLGSAWEPVLGIFPFIATGHLLGGVFSMHVSTLYVMGRNRQVTAAHAVNVALFAGTTLLAVPFIGLNGFGLGELAAIGSYPLLHRFVRRLVPLDYCRALPWILALVPVLFVPLTAFPWSAALLVPAGLVVFHPPARGQILELLGLLRSKASGHA